MYEYIKGNITELTPASMVIEAGNIGYFIHISLNSYSHFSGKEQTQVYLHFIVREDAQMLYGFADKEEREIFRKLISVSGIGANTGRMILSSMSPAEVRNAILEGNVNQIKSIKGIGLKTAQRVIIDLKDKIGSVSTSGSELFTEKDNTIKEEALSALVMLGFNKTAVNKVLDKIATSEASISVEELVKKALKTL